MINKKNKNDIQAHKILKQIQENEKRLTSCKQHEFTIDLRQNKVIGKRWLCKHCKGEVDGLSKYWYEQGLKHGKQLNA